MTLTQEQHARRATGIGASEVAAALGISKWQTPLELYMRKRGELASQEDALHFRFGHVAEGFILDEFERAHPDMRLVRSPDTLRKGALLAHLDALVPGRANVQAKTARSRQGWGEPGSADVPQEYIVQVQAEMLLANVSISYIPVLFAGSEYDEFVVERDRELQEMIADGVAEFWRRVETGDPPPPRSYSDVMARYGRRSEARHVIATDDVARAVERLRAIKEQARELDAEEEEAKAAICVALGDADTLVAPSGAIIATWKASKPVTRLDGKALQAAMPDVYSRFTVTGEPSRRLLIK